MFLVLSVFVLVWFGQGSDVLTITLGSSAGGVRPHLCHQFLLVGGEHRVPLLGCLVKLFLIVMDHPLEVRMFLILNAFTFYHHHFEFPFLHN